MTPEIAILVVETAAALVAAACALTPGRWGDEEFRRAWRWLGLGALAWGLGNTVYVVLALQGTDPGVPSLAEPGFLLALPLLAIGIRRWPTSTTTDDTRAVVLDGLLGAAAMILLLWVTVFHVLVGSPTSNNVELITTLLYPVGDVVILELLASKLLRRDALGRRPLAVLAAGIGAITVADLTYAVLSAARHRDLTDLATDAPWIIGFSLVGLSALMARQAPDAGPAAGHSTGQNEGPDTVEPAVTGEPATTGDQMPLARVSLYLGAVSLLAAVVRLGREGSSDLETILLSATVVSLILARQVNTLNVNNRLTARLKGEVARLSEQAHHDHLTGLPNRVGLEDRILAAGRRAAERDRLAAVMFIDLDHLKTVNDSLGHEYGDLLIQAVANRLTARLGDRVTRFGGDEFVVLVDDAAGTDAIDHLAQAVVADGTRPVDLDGLELRPSLSVGYAVVEDRTPPDELLRRADLALYRSKRLGRQRSMAFHPRMDDHSSRRVDLEPDLRRALEHDEFTVYFQPVVALCNDRLVGAEALIRWQHPTRGLVMPGEFLAEADSAGLLGAIGERALQQACAAFAEANRRPGQVPVVVSVNLSASELEDRHVVARVGLALERSGLAAHHLSLEITEDVIINRAIRRTIDDLLELGVNLSIDDFGTGNSSLRQLGSYPATALKIDRAYVAEMDRSPESLTVVRAIIGLAERFGMITIAEGVERQAQVDLLRELGCFAGQGWVYDRALPYPEFAARHLAGPRSRIDLRGPGASGASDSADDGAISLPSLVPDPPDASAPRPPR